jgi:hypothetical protein
MLLISIRCERFLLICLYLPSNYIFFGLAKTYTYYNDAYLWRSWDIGDVFSLQIIILAFDIYINKQIV